MPPLSSRSPTLLSALSLILAGSAGIAGESLGSLLLRRIVGSTSVSTYATLAATLGGIGIGAFAARNKRFADRLPAWVALAILALLTAAAPSLTSFLESTLAPLLATRSTGTRAVAAVVMVLPFAILQGSVLAQLASTIGTNPHQRVGFAGASSSLGSALGSLILLALVAPELGLRNTLYVAALFFALSSLTSREAKSPDNSQAPDAPIESLKSILPSAVASLVCIGFASTTLQIATLRMLTLSVGPTALTLATVLAAHTISLAMGEFFLARRAEDKRPTLQTLLTIACVMTVVSAGCAERVSQWAEHYFASHSPSSIALTARALLWSLAILAPSIVLVGALMARSGSTLTADQRTPTHASSFVFAATAGGNALAALTVPWWVVGRTGPMSAYVAAVVAFGLGLLCRFAQKRNWVQLALACISVGLVVNTTRQSSYDLHTRAPYLYAQNNVLGQLVSVAHSADAIVTVRSDDSGEMALHIDGKIDATARSDDDTQTLLGLIPAALSVRPSRALVVGLGSGRTIDALRSVDSVRSITVAERLASVVAAANGPFAESNHHVLSSPKVQLYLGDALSALRTPGTPFDLIISEPSNPWVTGMSELFTVEFFALTQQRLSTTGIFAAWFHSENSTLFAQLIATFHSVYRRCALVELNPRGDWLLIGMQPTGGVNVDQFAQVLQSPAVRAQLDRIGVDSTAGVLARFVAGPDGVSAMSQATSPLSANDLMLEFSSASLLYAPTSRAEIHTLLALAQDLPLAGLAPTGSAYQPLIDEANTLREASLHARQREVFAQRGMLSEAIAEGELAVAAAPRLREHRAALARVYVRRASRRYRLNDRGGSELDFRTALEVGCDSADTFRASAILGDMALSRHDHPLAIRYYRRALAAAQLAGAETPELRIRLAQLLVLAGDVAGARIELTIARSTCRVDERCAQIATALRQLPTGER